MADLATSLQTAKQAGYSDQQIADYLAKDPSYGSKVGTARQAGYSDAEIVSHLAGPQAAPAAPAPTENVYQKAGRLTQENYRAADQAYRADMATLDAKRASHSDTLVDTARPALDAVAGATSWLKGGADAVFGDQPVHLPPKILGMGVPNWAQNINSKGLTPGDIVTFGIPAAAELNAVRATAKAADAAGLTARTMDRTLQASKAGAAVAAAAPAAPNAVQQTVDQFDKARVRPTLAATGQGNATAAKAISENPIAGIRARANLQGSLDDTANAVDRNAQGYGQPAAKGATGEAVQQGIQNFNDRFSTRAESLYDRAFNKIGTGQEIAKQQAQSAAALKTAQGGARAVAEPVIDPSATSDVLAQINARGDSPALRDLFSTPQVAKLTQAVNNRASLSFQDLRSARTWVREAQKDDSLRQGVSQSDLGRLESSLTQDINSNAERIAGPKAARQLQQADQFYRLGMQRIQGALQKFVGKSEDMAGESTYDRLGRMAEDKGGADYQRLTALKKSLQPGEWGDVAASHLARMGQAPDGTFSVQRFVTGFDKLSDQGKDLLYGKGEQRDALENLADVARKQLKVEQAANRSNTAVSAQAVGTVAGLVSPHTAIPTALGLVGAGLTGEVLTNPAAVRFLARLGQAKSPAEVATQAKVIEAASRRNAALVPLAQAVRAIQAPAPLPAAAATSQEQATR